MVKCEFCFKNNCDVCYKIKGKLNNDIFLVLCNNIVNKFINKNKKNRNNDKFIDINIYDDNNLTLSFYEHHFRYIYQHQFRDINFNHIELYTHFTQIDYEELLTKNLCYFCNNGNNLNVFFHE